MSIQWRWTRRAINIPWQDRSRGEGRGVGEGERKEKWTSKRERKGGRKWVRGWAQWTDSFARLLLSFSLYVSTSVALHRTTRPLLCSVIYSQSRTDTRCWRLLHHIATLRLNHSLSICDCSLWVGLFITYRSGLKDKCISLLCECLYECSVCSYWYNTVKNHEKALYPPPASLVPRHLCRSHFGLLMRHQPSVPPLHLLLQLFLLTRESVIKVERQNKENIKIPLNASQREKTFCFPCWSWPTYF